MDFTASGSSDSGVCFALFSFMLSTHFVLDALPAERADSFGSCASSTLSKAITIILKLDHFKYPGSFITPEAIKWCFCYFLK